MAEVKDYTDNRANPHYNGVSSWYGKEVNKQNAQQPKYCEPGKEDTGMHGAHRNTQVGPKI